MKKLLLISSLVASSFLLSAYVGSPKATTYAEGETSETTPSSEVVVSSENTSSDVVSSSSEIVSSESSSKITFEDKDGDGIPDVITDYYNQKIRDQYLFGISLGSLIGLLTSIIGQIYIIKKNSGTNKLFKNSVSTQEEKLNELDTKLKEYEKLIKELEEAREDQTTDSVELLKKNEEQISAIIASLKESVGVLQNYANIDNKINAIIECIELLATTEELTKKGVTSEITKTLNEVK